MSKNNSTYGKSISIKHFLNTRLKPKPYVYEGRILDSYPLYVRVSVKRQSTMLRSYIQDYIPVELYEEFTKKFTSDLEIETFEIKKKVEDQNPFDNNSFILTDSLYSLDRQKLPLLFVISHALFVEIGNAIEKDFEKKIRDNQDLLFSNKILFSRFLDKKRLFYLGREDFIGQTPDYQIKAAASDMASGISFVFQSLPLQTFITFANNEFPEALKLWNKYAIEIWRIQDIISFMQEKTGLTLLIKDLTSGHFEDVYLSVFQHDQEINSIKSSIETLSNTCRALADAGQKMVIC